MSLPAYHTMKSVVNKIILVITASDEEPSMSRRKVHRPLQKEKPFSVHTPENVAPGQMKYEKDQHPVTTHLVTNQS